MESSRVLRYYPSVLKMALLVVGAAAFVAVGFWMLSISSARGDFTHVLLAYVGIGFCGLCGLVGLWQCLTRLFTRRPWLVVEPRGIRWRSGTKLRGV
ncbi:MAG TPA: STM3941 family protein, partial [Ktedonobacterales bacterium]|nr:STM3941 family protein [Ktedonobacterales bacterium]